MSSFQDLLMVYSHGLLSLNQLPQRDQMRHDMVQPSRYPVRPQLPERSQMRHDMVQTSPYPGAGDCIQYLQTGKCSYGPKCRFNHPPSPVSEMRTQIKSIQYSYGPKFHGLLSLKPLPQRDIGAIDCRQYLQTGQCSYGPKCRYNHPPSPVRKKESKLRYFLSKLKFQSP